MLKYSFLAHHSDYATLLQQLQDMGVVHVIESKHELSEQLNQDLTLLNQEQEIIRYLNKRTSKDGVPSLNLNALQWIDKISALRSDIEKTEQQNHQLLKEALWVEPWGNFSTKSISELKKCGFVLKFFQCAEKRFKEEWVSEYPIEIIAKNAGLVYFVGVETPVLSLNIDADEINVVQSKNEIDGLIQQNKEKIEEWNSVIDIHLNSALEALNEEARQLENKISFEKAKAAGIGIHDKTLLLLEGWVPKEREKATDELLDQSGVIFVKSPPNKWEFSQVPILLKNNKFSKLLEPIGQLYSLPKFGELDLTPFFAPFYVLFYGMCMADAGYGLVFVLASLLLIPKVKGALKGYLKLAFYLGLSTIFFGLLTGTLFGIELVKTDWAMFAWLRPHILNGKQIFYLALIFGVIQILFGMFIKAANMFVQLGFAYSLSTIGWILLIISSIAFGLIQQTKSLPAEQLMLYYKIAAIVSGALILIFNNPATNIFASIGGGLWDVYSTSTGILGDILSYIRLFALGVSGAILGLVFNNIALTVLNGGVPVVSQFFFVVILLFGHGINLFMSALGSFVHPMRLTFVEFYKNAGFTGGGKEYKPFVKS